MVHSWNRGIPSGMDSNPVTAILTYGTEHLGEVTTMSRCSDLGRKQKDPGLALPGSGVCCSVVCGTIGRHSKLQTNRQTDSDRIPGQKPQKIRFLCGNHGHAGRQVAHGNSPACSGRRCAGPKMVSMDPRSRRLGCLLLLDLPRALPRTPTRAYSNQYDMSILP